MSTATLTSPGQQEIIDILKAAHKGMTSREIFAKAKGFEDADAVSKALNYAMKKGVVEREKVAQNTYAYWLASGKTNDTGNTLLRGTDGQEEVMPDQSEHALAMVLAAHGKTLIDDHEESTRIGARIDATTQAMADQAEIAYQTLSEALELTPQQMCDVTLTDLAVTAAAMISLEKKGKPVAWRVELKAGEYSFLENKYATEKNVSLSPTNHAIPLYAAPPALKSLCQANEGYRLHNEKLLQQQRDTELTAGGMAMLIDQIRHALDIGPASSGTDILAEIENLSRRADRAIQTGERDAASGPYVVITTIHSGEINDLTLAREKAELVAKRSTEGHAAVAQIIASVELAPKWSDAA